MNLEQQVCSLKLAKKLKALGVKQESAFYWWGRLIDAGENAHLIRHGQITTRDGATIASAFTVAELGEILPEFAISYRYFSNDGLGEKFACHSDNDDDVDTWGYDFRQIANTEADCRAKMLVYLIEKGIVKP